MLNQQDIQRNWKEIKAGVRNIWARVSEDEIEQNRGNLYDLSSTVERKYGETKEEIKMKLDNLMASFDNETDKGITPDESSFGRSPLTSEESQNFDSDIETRSPERKEFDKRTYEKSKEEIDNPSEQSNYNGANPNRTEINNFDNDRNA